MARDGYRIFDSDTHVGPDAAILSTLSERGRKGPARRLGEYNRATGRSGHVTYTKGQRQLSPPLGAAEPG